MRHLAWLHATPEGSKKSRLKSYTEQSEESIFLQLPEIDGADYLVSLLHEAGLVSQNGMSISPIDWQEIQAWLDTLFSISATRYVHDGCGVYIPTVVKESSLSTWEITTLKEMSEAYASEFNQASDKARPAPYKYVIEEIDRVAVGNKIKNLFRSLKKS